MIYTLLEATWTAINAILLVIFFGLCAISVRLINKHYNGYYAIVYILGLLAFITNSYKKEESENPVANNSSLEIVELDQSPLSKISVFISYTKTDSTFRILNKSSNLTGLVMGKEYTEERLILTQASNDSLNYILNYSIAWQLFKFPILTQYKTKEGQIKSKPTEQNLVSKKD